MLGSVSCWEWHSSLLDLTSPLQLDSIHACHSTSLVDPTCPLNAHQRQLRGLSTPDVFLSLTSALIFCIGFIFFVRRGSASDLLFLHPIGLSSFPGFHICHSNFTKKGNVSHCPSNVGKIFISGPIKRYNYLKPSLRFSLYWPHCNAMHWSVRVHDKNWLAFILKTVWTKTP